MTERQDNLISTLSDEEKAIFAAEILSMVDPTRTNLMAFIGNLDEMVKDELSSRMEDNL